LQKPDGRGWLSIYRRTALSLDQGASLAPAPAPVKTVL